MYISLQNDQAVLLREILQSSLHDLRIQSARSDTHDFREKLHARERLVESVLAKLSEEDHARLA